MHVDIWSTIMVQTPLYKPVDRVIALVLGGREPPDFMSLCYADKSLPDLLGRLSLRHADQASAI